MNTPVTRVPIKDMGRVEITATHGQADLRRLDLS
jgi:hypothetical protein